MRMDMVVLAMGCKLLQRVEIVTGKGMPVNEGQVVGSQLENTSREHQPHLPLSLSLPLSAYPGNCQCSPSQVLVDHFSVSDLYLASPAHLAAPRAHVLVQRLCCMC